MIYLFLLLTYCKSITTDLEWAIAVKESSWKIENISKKYGLTYITQILPNVFYYRSSFSDERTKHFQTEVIKEKNIFWIKKQKVKKMQPRIWFENSKNLQNVSRSQQQSWNDLYLGIQAVWRQGYTGTGVVVSIIDDGLDSSHPDLVDNYDPNASAEVLHLDNQYLTCFSVLGHGTKCAGVIAASRNSNLCLKGISYNAKIGGICLFSYHTRVTDGMEAAAFNHAIQHIDIYLFTWGPYDDGWTVNGPGHLSEMAIKEGIKSGRKHLGSLYVIASGNGGFHGDSCAFDGYVNSIYTLAFSGITSQGLIPDYAEPCAGILASAFTTYSKETSNMITTGQGGKCVDDFSGTSVAASIAAGILALVLEANNHLTWRDIQYIIALTSKQSGLLSDDWKTNSAGYNVSHYFGFGLIDASAMIDHALTWTKLPQQLTQMFSCLHMPKKIVNTGIFSYFITVPYLECTEGNVICFMEHVQCQFSFSSIKGSNLIVHLLSPEGTNSTLLFPRKNTIVITDLKNWTVLSLHYWGEDPRGEWMLQIFYQFTPDQKQEVVLSEWNLILYGTSISRLAGTQPSRKKKVNYKTILPEPDSAKQKQIVTETTEQTTVKEENSSFKTTSSHIRKTTSTFLYFNSYDTELKYINVSPITFCAKIYLFLIVINFCLIY